MVQVYVKDAISCINNKKQLQILFVFLFIFFTIIIIIIDALLGSAFKSKVLQIVP